MRIPISRLILGDNVVAGANILVVATFAYRYRSTTEDLDPALVRDLGGGLYRIVDGRHRFLAAVIAGRPDLLCSETTEP